MLVCFSMLVWLWLVPFSPCHRAGLLTLDELLGQHQDLGVGVSVRVQQRKRQRQVGGDSVRMGGVCNECRCPLPWCSGRHLKLCCSFKAEQISEVSSASSSKAADEEAWLILTALQSPAPGITASGTSPMASFCFCSLIYLEKSLLFLVWQVCRSARVGTQARAAIRQKVNYWTPQQKPRDVTRLKTAQRALCQLEMASDRKDARQRGSTLGQKLESEGDGGLNKC